MSSSPHSGPFHVQPHQHFPWVAGPAIKAQVREAGEEEGRGFYGGGASDAWLKALDEIAAFAEQPAAHEPALPRALTSNQLAPSSGDVDARAFLVPGPSWCLPKDPETS